MHSILRVLVLGLTVAACAATSTRGPASPASRASPPVETGELPVAPDSLARVLLVDLERLDSTIVIEARYTTPNNFTGTPLPGYEANRALLRREAAAALARVQRSLTSRGLSLKVFDGYRPVRATLAMMEWTTRTGQEHLVRDGYIASRSRHNLGLAVDLTLVERRTGEALDMGTPFDTFSSAAHTANATGQVAANRQLLRQAMEREGFSNYEKEWWHFSYEVPDPLRFDIVIR